MSPQTKAPAPTDKGMWRKLLSMAHPDRGGSHEVFIWTKALHEYVTGNSLEDLRTSSAEKRQPPRHHTTAERVDFSAVWAKGISFAVLTAKALNVAERVPEPYKGMLMSLEDCEPSYNISLARQQEEGATYRSLARAAHSVGLSKEERVNWYRLAEKIPLSQRHVGHIIKRVEGGQ